MRILVATDAWHPQVNGVVRTHEALAREVRGLGAELDFLTPGDFRTVPCPTYPEIRLALTGRSGIARRIEKVRADVIHIATEGPIGIMTQRHCLKAGRPFTTSYHTRFPDYFASRWPIPLDWGYALQRRFHRAAAGIMVASQSLARELSGRGFERLLPWTRGVDTTLFRPRPVRLFGPQPVFLHVGRVAVEKNIEAFLRLPLPGRKVVVGRGPMLDTLKSRYSDATFTGPLFGEALAEAYASADVLVFPSRTDTFGLVMLEALAAGVPVAAYPTACTQDLLTPQSGVLDDDLGRAAITALALDGSLTRARAVSLSWTECARQFLRNAEFSLG